MQHFMRHTLSLMLLLFLATETLGNNVPDPLRDVLFGAHRRPIDRVELEGFSFDAIVQPWGVPRLLWPTIPGSVKAQDPQSLGDWLGRSGMELGHGTLEPSYMGPQRWRGLTVWAYELRLSNLPLHDVEVLVYLQGDRILGIWNGVPGRLPNRPVSPRSLDEDSVLVAQRRGFGPTNLQLAHLEKTRSGNREMTTVVTSKGAQYATTPPKLRRMGSVPMFAFQEYDVPVGNFPDQIAVDSKGIVWFTQPNHDFLTAFDPLAKTFTQHPVPVGSGPDGMIVDPLDRLWTGFYYTGELGVFDIPTSTLTVHAASYAPSSLAIPYFTTRQTIWISDHQNNRISEWNPAAGAWLQSHEIPTSNSWVVEGIEDPRNGDMYFTENAVNAIAIKPRFGNIVEVSTPPGAPGFMAYYDEKVYYSEWLGYGLVAYDIAQGTFLRYDFPKREWGGPLAKGPGDEIVIGTRNRGQILVFHADDGTWERYELPTRQAGLKDGIAVAPDGTIWFAETGKNRIAKLQRF